MYCESSRPYGRRSGTSFWAPGLRMRRVMLALAVVVSAAALSTLPAPHSAPALSAGIADWTPLAPAHSPGARYGAAVEYDQATGQLVLFAGQDSAGNPLNDTWAWTGGDWS